MEDDSISNGRVRHDDFEAELVMPFREVLAVPSTYQLLMKHPQVSIYIGDDGWC